MKYHHQKPPGRQRPVCHSDSGFDGPGRQSSRVLFAADNCSVTYFCDSVPQRRQRPMGSSGHYRRWISALIIPWRLKESWWPGCGWATTLFGTHLGPGEGLLGREQYLVARSASSSQTLFGPGVLPSPKPKKKEKTRKEYARVTSFPAAGGMEPTYPRLLTALVIKSFWQQNTIYRPPRAAR